MLQDAIQHTMIQNGIQIYFTGLSVSWEQIVQTRLKPETPTIPWTNADWDEPSKPSCRQTWNRDSNGCLRYAGGPLSGWLPAVGMSGQSGTTCSANYILWTTNAMLQRNWSVPGEPLSFIYSRTKCSYIIRQQLLWPIPTLCTIKPEKSICIHKTFINNY